MRRAQVLRAVVLVHERARGLDGGRVGPAVGDHRVAEGVQGRQGDDVATELETEP